MEGQPMSPRREGYGSFQKAAEVAELCLKSWHQLGKEVDS